MVRFSCRPCATRPSNKVHGLVGMARKRAGRVDLTPFTLEICEGASDKASDTCACAASGLCAAVFRDGQRTPDLSSFSSPREGWEPGEN